MLRGSPLFRDTQSGRCRFYCCTNAACVRYWWYLDEEPVRHMRPDQIQGIGTFLRTKREELGLSLRDLQDRSGVGNSVIARFEIGAINRPDPDKLARLSRALGVPLTEVLAAGDVTSGADLPSLPVYLRSRYGELPEEAIEQMDRYFARLARSHGVDPAGPNPGEDEEPLPTRRERRKSRSA